MADYAGDDDMKRWLVRSFWLAAWSAWLWAGYGLWRELPRKVGSVVGTVHLEPEESPMCALPGEEAVITFQSRGEDGATIRHRALHDSTVLNEFHTPSYPNHWTDRPPTAFLSFKVGEQFRSAFVDLLAGRKIDIGEDVDFEDCPRLLNEERHWIVGARSAADRAEEGERALIIFDYTDGRIIGEAPGGIHGVGEVHLAEHVAFLPGSDELLLSFFFEDPPKLNIWSIPPGPAPARRLNDPGVKFPAFVDDHQISRNSRVVWDNPEEEWTTVLDLRNGDVVYADPPMHQRGKAVRPDHRARHPQISKDGRTIVAQSGGDVIDVESGKVLWSHEKSHSGWIDRSGSLLRVPEHAADLAATRRWNQWLGALLPSMRIGARWIGEYELRTGRLIQRVDQGDFRARCGKSGEFYLSDQGLLTTADPTPRWGLIALLQSILAAPLVGLWGLLRWRKWRRARAAP